MISSLKPADTCMQHLQTLRLTSRAGGAELKAYAPQGLLRRESEVSLSEAAQAIASGKKVTLKEEKVTRIQSQVSLLLGWKTYNTVISVVQQLQTPIRNAAELEEFNNFKSGERTTQTQQVAAQLERQESGERYGEFNMILPVKSTWLGLGSRKVSKKFEEPELDTRVIPSLSAFATARHLQDGKAVAIANVETDAVLNHDYSFKEGVHSRIISSPQDLR